MKKILIIFSCIALIVLGVKVRQWVLYIDQLNHEEQIKYELAINEEIGNAEGNSELFYCVRNYGAPHLNIVSDSNAYEYTKKVYDYFDLGLLFGDLSCVNYEVHFFDIETKEEEIFNYRPYEMSKIDATGIYELNEVETFYVENGEYKVFFRYAPSYGSLGRDYRLYGSFVYNFTTGKYEAFYESDNVIDEDFINMSEGIINCEVYTLYALLRDDEFCELNGLPMYPITHCVNDNRIVMGVLGCELPERNEGLYELYPYLYLKLKQYKETYMYENIIVLSFPMDMDPEELIKMFMEDGKEITYEGVCVDAEVSIDGLSHEVSSYREYEYYLDIEKYSELHCLNQLEVIFQCIPGKYLPD